jgi:hypothetical protein
MLDPNATCKIQWVDEDGKPTPDDNPAIGRAWTVAHDFTAQGYKRHADESDHYPICADHAKRGKLNKMTRRFLADGMEWWRFEFGSAVRSGQ